MLAASIAENGAKKAKSPRALKTAHPLTAWAVRTTQRSGFQRARASMAARERKPVMNTTRKNVDLKQPAPQGSEDKSMNDVLSLRATNHACTRYAQRVLGMDVEERHLRANSVLRGRCARGIARLLQRARPGETTERGEVWIAGTRALVITNACVITLIVAPTSKGFPKRFFRRHAAVERAA